MAEDSDDTLADDAAGEAAAPEASADDATAAAAPAEASAADDATATAADAASGADDADAEAKAERKAKADAAVAERQVVARRTVQSRRVTPKGGPAAAKKTGDSAPVSTSKARDAKKTASVVTKAPTVTPPQVYAKGPSPWWVPAIMFGLLIIGALIIMSNYMGVFGDASNVRLVIGLGFILGGIVTATQYR